MTHAQAFRWGLMQKGCTMESPENSDVSLFGGFEVETSIMEPKSQEIIEQEAALNDLDTLDQQLTYSDDDEFENEEDAGIEMAPDSIPPGSYLLQARTIIHTLIETEDGSSWKIALTSKTLKPYIVEHQVWMRAVISEWDYMPGFCSVEYQGLRFLVAIDALSAQAKDEK